MVYTVSTPFTVVVTAVKPVVTAVVAHLLSLHEVMVTTVVWMSVLVAVESAEVETGTPVTYVVKTPSMVVTTVSHESVSVVTEQMPALQTVLVTKKVDWSVTVSVS